MALTEIHSFLTRYIRDTAFRSHWKGDMKDELIDELSLSDADLETINQVPLHELDIAADGMQSDRLDKRYSEYLPFLEQLKYFYDPEEFLKQYDAHYPRGREALPVELDQLLSFSTKFVAANNLPDYLVTMARFCHAFTRVAYTPIVKAENKVHIDSMADMEIFHTVRLSEPFAIKEFRYDALAIANDDSGGFTNPLPQYTSLLFQKSRKEFKRSTIWNVSDLPAYVTVLAEGPQSVADLIGIYGCDSYRSIVDSLLMYQREGILEICVPAIHVN